MGLEALTLVVLAAGIAVLIWRTIGSKRREGPDEPIPDDSDSTHVVYDSRDQSLEHIRACAEAISNQNPLESAREICDMLAEIQARDLENQPELTTDDARFVAESVRRSSEEFASAEERAVLRQSRDIACDIVLRWGNAGGRVVVDDTFFNAASGVMSDSDKADYRRAQAGECLLATLSMETALRFVRCRSKVVLPHLQSLDALEDGGRLIAVADAMQQMASGLEVKHAIVTSRDGTTESGLTELPEILRCGVLSDGTAWIVDEDYEVWISPASEDEHWKIASMGMMPRGYRLLSRFPIEHEDARVTEASLPEPTLFNISTFHSVFANDEKRCADLLQTEQEILALCDESLRTERRNS